MCTLPTARDSPLNNFCHPNSSAISKQIRVSDSMYYYGFIAGAGGPTLERVDQVRIAYCVMKVGIHITDHAGEVV